MTAAFYAAPANFAAHTSDKLQFKLDGSEGKNGKCLGVEDHHNVQDGTKLMGVNCGGDSFVEGDVLFTMYPKYELAY